MERERGKLLSNARSLLVRTCYSESWKACQSLLLLAPGWWRARAAAARTRLEWGKAEEEGDDHLLAAIVHFDVALASIDEGDAESPTAAVERIELSNDRGVALYELGRLDEARASFDRVLELQPGHERALCNLGLIHWTLGHHRAALSTFDHAIASANGRNPHSLNNRGVRAFAGTPLAHHSPPETLVPVVRCTLPCRACMCFLVPALGRRFALS